MSESGQLYCLRDRLAQALTAGRGDDTSYTVPGRWIAADGAAAPQSVNPYRFYLQQIDRILAQDPAALPTGEGGEWSRQAVVYNILVRATTAFDHDRDGRLSLEPIGDGWHETGTFAKSIALLPTLRDLGFNAVHLLPVTAVGQDGHKGTLGSIYGIQNPYRLDPRQAEPALEMAVEEEFAAFVEAAHHLGMRVVVEFVFRTGSLDADWAAEHPEWFYWIRADVPDRQAGDVQENAYGAPVFTVAELAEIKGKVDRGDREGLIPPHDIYREMFTSSPPPESVHREGTRWIGVLTDGTRVRIPGAFADWPPDDPQPPWTDVTNLRLYDHPDFNYIAYNTVRMYDRRLAQPENRVEPLWEHIIGILPSYQERFGIDGAMIDMGHALPPDLKRRIVAAARAANPQFAFWDETFDYHVGLVEEGYNAIIGNYWWMTWRPEKLVWEFLRPLADAGFPLPFFAAPESHNTPRAAARPGGLRAARLAWALGCVLPAIPFCHSGFELAETTPVNTGLDFTPEELPRYPQEALPLFSAAAYGWENEPALVDWVRRTLAIRARHADLITDRDPASLDLLGTDNPNVWAVARQRDGARLVAVFNLDVEHSHSFSLRLSTDRSVLSDLFGDTSIPLDEGWWRGELPPAGCVLVEI